MPVVMKKASVSTRRSLRVFVRNNGLSLAVLGLFLLSMVGQTLAGLREHNTEQQQHGEPAVTLSEYLKSGHFIEATAENWESEFLQMAFYVLLTAFLFQKGSSESKKMQGGEPVDRDPRGSKGKKDVPWPVQRGGWVLKLYENSLTLVFFALFLVSFSLHARGGAEQYNEDQLVHGGSTISVLQYLGTSQFWFESFQNWQSEFLSLAAMVILSIYLRQRGSPESKPVDAPHSQTGSE
jgi:hypothetical protein